MPAATAERIRALIDAACRQAVLAGHPLDLTALYETVLVRCGLDRDEARRLACEDGDDPVARILHYAGESHNFALLAVEEALAAA